MNETVIRQLEKILGTSLTPTSPAGKEVLRQALKREIDELGKYVKKIGKYQDRAQQPDKKLSRLDGFFCPHVTAMENARHPDLQLEHFNDMPSFIAHLQDSSRTNTPPIRRVFVRCGEDTGTLHHVVIDIVRANGKLSLICLEPVPLHAPPVMSAVNSLDRGLRGLEPQPYVWSYLSCNVQTSGNDCLPFGHSLAKQMKNEPDFMDEMQERQLAGKPLRTSKSPEGEGASLEEAVASETHNMHQVIGNAHTFMPPRFLKHTNSLNSMEAWMNERLQDKGTPASKGSESYSPQSLLKYVKDHVPQLGRWIRDETSFRETTHHYNTSIENERKEAAEKTLELFRHIEKTLDESY